MKKLLVSALCLFSVAGGSMAVPPDPTASAMTTINAPGNSWYLGNTVDGGGVNNTVTNTFGGSGWVSVASTCSSGSDYVEATIIQYFLRSSASNSLPVSGTLDVTGAVYLANQVASLASFGSGVLSMATSSSIPDYAVHQPFSGTITLTSPATSVSVNATTIAQTSW